MHNERPTYQRIILGGLISAVLVAGGLIAASGDLAGLGFIAVALIGVRSERVL